MRYALLLLLVTYAFTCSAQKMDTTYRPALNSYDYYIKKSKTNKTIGFILLGSGVLISAISYGTYAGNDFNGPFSGNDALVLGGVMAVGSIPFFIFAGSNKRKARLALKGETSGISHRHGNSYTAISLQLDL